MKNSLQKNIGNVVQPAAAKMGHELGQFIHNFCPRMNMNIGVFQANHI
jgi:hypothetical protein